MDSVLNYSKLNKCSNKSLGMPNNFEWLFNEKPGGP